MLFGKKISKIEITPTTNNCSEEGFLSNKIDILFQKIVYCINSIHTILRLSKCQSNQSLQPLNHQLCQPATLAFGEVLPILFGQFLSRGVVFLLAVVDYLYFHRVQFYTKCW